MYVCNILYIYTHNFERLKNKKKSQNDNISNNIGVCEA